MAKGRKRAASNGARGDSGAGRGERRDSQHKNNDTRRIMSDAKEPREEHDW
jgi:hypothetical protein